MNKKLIVANWKNNITSLAQAGEILNAVNEFLEPLGENVNFHLVVCPEALLLEGVSGLLKKSHLEQHASLGIQDLELQARPGRQAWPVSVQSMGVRYVIIGHSDKRKTESDEIVNQKLKQALAQGLIPIVCLGEKNQGEGAGEFLKNQTLATFKDVSTDDISRCIIAYEPVWAISSTPGSASDDPQSAFESIKIIIDLLFRNLKLDIRNSPKVLYGGSADSSNASGFLNIGFDGFLVGYASTDREEFVKILRIMVSK